MKKVLFLFVVLALCLSVTGAFAEKVGVSMPTKDLQRWNQDGDYMKANLEAAGYEVDLQYASNDVQTQLSQVENMINSGADVIVIAAIEGSSLGSALAMAKENEIPVIAYDRLLMDSDGVSYYATFDNYMVGTVQGTYVKERALLSPGSPAVTSMLNGPAAFARSMVSSMNLPWMVPTM